MGNQYGRLGLHRLPVLTIGSSSKGWWFLKRHRGPDRTVVEEPFVLTPSQPNLQRPCGGAIRVDHTNFFEWPLKLKKRIFRTFTRRRAIKFPVPASPFNVVLIQFVDNLLFHRDCSVASCAHHSYFFVLTVSHALLSTDKRFPPWVAEGSHNSDCSGPHGSNVHYFLKHGWVG